MNRPLVPLCVRSQWYALDAPLVVEVLGRQPWVPIPGASSRSPGVMAWQGRAIALVDLQTLTNGQSDDQAAAQARERVVIVRAGPTTLAIPADMVREVHDVPEEQLRPPRLVTTRFTAAETELAGTIMPVLDVAELVRDILREAEASTA